MIHVVLFQPDGSLTFGGRELLDTPVPEEGAVWIDVQGHSAENESLFSGFGFHPLAVEDTFTLQHQPKLEEYDDHLFVIVRGIDFSHHQLQTLKLAAFVAPRRLVTYHRAHLRSVATVRQRLEEARRAKVDMVHLFYLLCDELMDLYFPIVEEASRELEELEERIFEEPRQEQLEKILELRRRLSTLRRVMLPHRQIFNHLASGQLEMINDSQALYFRDVYDNVFRLADAVDQQRDQLSSARDTYLSAVSQRTNEVMKVLTLFSATLLPLSVIAGVYGMNFQFMPETHFRYSYFVVLGVMLVVGIGMVAWFKRRGWF